MFVSEQGLALIKQFEGFCANSYVCPAGKLTIGYGHVIRPGEHFDDAGISENDAENLLKQDVSYAEHMVGHCVLVDLNQNQFDALVSFSYNIGVEAFVNSTLLEVLNSGDIEAAGQQFSHWIYANGQKLPGLIARRSAEAAVFLKND